MSDQLQAEAKPKKGKSLIVKLLFGLVLIGAGGGGTFALLQSGIVGGGGEDKAKTKGRDVPKLLRKGEKDPYAPVVEDGEGAGGAEVEGEGGSAYRTAYYNFTEDFTSNLKNSDSLLQVSLACSTRRDGRVLMWLKKHELAIRSAILVVIADTPEDEVVLPEGKQRLQARITAAINQVLVRTEGFGGVDAVYFKNFIVQ